MAYTKITAAHKGADAIAYLQGTGHNGNSERNMYMTGINMVSPDTVSYTAQMNKYWNRASDKMKVQVRRVTQSFSAKELNPENACDILKAHEIGIESGKRIYGNRQFIVATQIDGKSGLIHNHIFGNNVEMQTLKGMRGNDYQHDRISKISDTVIKEFGVELDYGENHGEKYTQPERAKRDAGKYVWKDDLKDRIRESMDESTDFDIFEKALAYRGVSLRNGKTLTYTLDDTTAYEEFYGEKPKKSFKARPRSLGSAFDKEHLNKVFAENQNKTTVQVTTPPTNVIQTEPYSDTSETSYIKHTDSLCSDGEEIHSADATNKKVELSEEEKDVVRATMKAMFGNDYVDPYAKPDTVETPYIEHTDDLEPEDEIHTEDAKVADKQRMELEERRKRRLRSLQGRSIGNIDKAYEQLHNMHSRDSQLGE